MQTRMCGAVAGVVFLFGCAGPKLASAEEVAVAERRFDAPFEHQRGIVGDKLIIEVSANFDDAIARPAVDKNLHELAHVRGDGHDEYRWMNRGGGVEMPLRFVIGKTEYAILDSATLRVMHSGPMRLSSVVVGNVLVDASDGIKQVQEYRIEDGAVRIK